jgi:hypothetical protein
LLFRPVGYANALGILAAIGVALAAGFILHSDHLVERVGAAAALVPLVAALYLSGSRGAWLALAVAIAALVGFESERLRAAALLVSLVPFVGLAVVLSWHAHLRAHSALFQSHRADRLGLELLILTGMTGALASRLSALVDRVRKSRAAVSPSVCTQSVSSARAPSWPRY